MNPTLPNLRRAALRYGIKVVSDGGGRHREIELEAPNGFCFDDELHVLVTEQGDADTWTQTIANAMRDIAAYGPSIKPCPANCPCKEVD